MISACYGLRAQDLMNFMPKQVEENHKVMRFVPRFGKKSGHAHAQRAHGHVPKQVEEFQWFSVPMPKNVPSENAGMKLWARWARNGQVTENFTFVWARNAGHGGHAHAQESPYYIGVCAGHAHPL